MKRILDRIDEPADLKTLGGQELIALCAEIREQILETVAQTGGHLGAGLGAVELTVAIHRVFDSPRDRIVWDVGHQAYGHKLLTGRRDNFGTLRQHGGISGFPVPAESEHDSFGVGHAGTSLSAGLGMATALEALGSDARVVCVIGDGALTCGMAFEALNQAGHLKKDLIVVLNDNEWSISKNVGALSTYLTRLTSAPLYRRLEADVYELIGKIPKAGGTARVVAHRIKESLKNLIVPGVMFEELGFKYFGPIDGHDLLQMISTLEQLKNLRGPILLHAVTEKGKGHPIASQSKTRVHALPPKTDPAEKDPAAGPSYTKVFGDTLVELGERDPKVVAITAAMPDGTGTAAFGERFPERFFDVGIAEQHAVTFAAGMASVGLKPVCAIYSTFLQRAFDQVVHDVALQKLPVTFVMDRGGLVGDDGPTHHGVLDVAYLRVMPNMVVMAPKDENELRHMLYTQLHYQEGPTALRYPRGHGYGVALDPVLEEIPIGEAEILRSGTDVVFLAYGSMVYPSLDAANALRDEGLSAGVVNARFAKPLDEGVILELAHRSDFLVTVEEAQRAGGFGGAVMELLQDRGLGGVRILTLALPDAFVAHGGPERLREEVGLSAASIAARTLAFVEHPSRKRADTHSPA